MAETAGRWKKIKGFFDNALLGGAEASSYRKNVYEIYQAGGDISKFEKAVLGNQYLTERLDYLNSKHNALLTSIPPNLRDSVSGALNVRGENSNEIAKLKTEEIQLKNLQKKINKTKKLCKEFEKFIKKYPDKVSEILKKANADRNPDVLPFNVRTVKLGSASQSTLEQRQKELKDLLEQQDRILNKDTYKNVNATIKEGRIGQKVDKDVKTELVNTQQKLLTAEQELVKLQEKPEDRKYFIPDRKYSIEYKKRTFFRDRIVFTEDGTDEKIEYKVSKKIKNKYGNQYTLTRISYENDLSSKDLLIFHDTVGQYQNNDGSPASNKAESAGGIVRINAPTKSQFDAIENAKNKTVDNTTITLKDLLYQNKIFDKSSEVDGARRGAAKHQQALAEEAKKHNKSLQKSGGKALNNAEKELDEVRTEMNNGKKPTRFQRFVERISYGINRGRTIKERKIFGKTIIPAGEIIADRQRLETDTINKLRLAQNQIRKTQEQTSKSVEKAQKSLLKLATNLGVDVKDKGLQQILADCQIALDAKQGDVEKYQKDHPYRRVFNKAAQTLVVGGVVGGMIFSGGTGATIATTFAITGVVGSMMTGPRKTYLIEKTYRDAKDLGKQVVGVAAGIGNILYKLGKKTINNIHKNRTGEPLFTDVDKSWKTTSKEAWGGKKDSPNFASRMRNPQRTKSTQTSTKLENLSRASRATDTRPKRVQKEPDTRAGTTVVKDWIRNKFSGTTKGSTTTSTTTVSTVSYDAKGVTTTTSEIPTQKSPNPLTRFNEWRKNRSDDKSNKIKDGLRGLGDSLTGTKIISSTSSTKPDKTPPVQESETTRNK